MRNRLPERRVLEAFLPGQREALEAAREISRRTARPLYLVGGPIRDLLLGRAISDLDLTVEGDAPRFAADLARAICASLRVHRRFGTATVEVAGGCRVDLVTARSEIYERPGALPRVAPAKIHEDLARRDFTINAMAVRLAPEYRAAVLDPHGGRADLQSGTLRFLHDASPVDDPTRAFRAVRYANRFRFRLAAAARASIRRALREGGFAAVSGDRLRREIEKIFEEPGRGEALALLGRIGLHAAVHPALPGGGLVLGRLRRAEAEPAASNARWTLYLLIWASGLDPAQCEGLARRLTLARRDAATLRRWPATLERMRRFPGRVSGLSRGLAVLSMEERLAAAACVGSAARGAILRRSTALRIQGRDLLRAGASPGPAIGSALARTLSARREGRISEAEELDYALAAIRETE